jgi:hypothetical protein
MCGYDFREGQVMKAAEDGRRYNVTHVLDGAMDRSVLVERPMSSQLVLRHDARHRATPTKQRRAIEQPSGVLVFVLTIVLVIVVIAISML